MESDDHKILMQLVAQIGQVAETLEILSSSDRKIPKLENDMRAFNFEIPIDDISSSPASEASHMYARPSLPDPRLVRRIISNRTRREAYFDSELFADPAWDMMLDLTAAQAEHVRVSITSLCIASGVAPSTALRWISKLVEAGLFKRMEDSVDRRRVFITLTRKADEAISRYFACLEQNSPKLI